ncbi:MAG: hypothetical protein NXH70_00935 [Hyphomonas sp.]|jgi:hypothetical protein|nr:hypothetical protein [Hyphomonas sp.]
MRALIVPAICSLMVAACEPQTEVSSLEAETPPPAPQQVEQVPDTTPANETANVASAGNVAETRTANIDWTQARQDFASRESDNMGMVQVASVGSPAVPVLLPDEPVTVASTGENSLDFRPTADGYFAVRKGEVFDMIINGTDRLVARSGSQGAAPDSEMKFEETMTGSQVSFSRYGASYLVEFMCKDPATAAKGSCVTEEEAVAEVEKLLIAGTR